MNDFINYFDVSQGYICSSCRKQIPWVWCRANDRGHLWFSTPAEFLIGCRNNPMSICEHFLALLFWQIWVFHPDFGFQSRAFYLLLSFADLLHDFSLEISLIFLFARALLIFWTHLFVCSLGWNSSWMIHYSDCFWSPNSHTSDNLIAYVGFMYYAHANDGYMFCWGSHFFWPF